MLKIPYIKINLFILRPNVTLNLFQDRDASRRILRNIILTLSFLFTPQLNAVNTTAPIIVEDNVFIIEQSDLDQTAAASGAMFTISTSGYYYLTANLTGTPTNNTVSVIRISSDNVILDLNNKTILRSGGAGTGLILIEISSGQANITIKNGTLADSQIGIQLLASDNVTLKDLLITNSSNLGINSVTGTKNVLTLERVSVNNGTGADGSSAQGAAIRNTNNLTISNCHFDDNIATSGTKGGIGLQLVTVVSGNISNTTANRNTAVGGGGSFGFYLFAVGSCIFKNCVATKNTGSGGASGAGFLIGLPGNTSDGNIFDSCIANKNSPGATASIASAGAGFFLNTADRNTFLNCIANENDAAGTTSSGIGFYVSIGNDNKFYNCLAQGNIAGTTAATNPGSSSSAGDSGSRGAGFYINNASRCVFENCSALANYGRGGTAYGFAIEGSSSSNHVILNCQMHDNYSDDPTTPTSAQYGYRDFTVPQTSTFLTKNISSGQGLISPGVSASPTLTAHMNYMWNASGATHNANALVAEPINLTRMDQIDSAFLFQNVSASET
jgi:hypothetical protein